MVDEYNYLVFHRLCINDLSEAGNQPLNHPNDVGLTLICVMVKFTIIKNSYSKIISHLVRVVIVRSFYICIKNMELNIQ